MFISRLLKKSTLFLTIMIMVLTTVFGSLVKPAHAMAAVVNPLPAAKVSFTFDDGLASAATQAAPVLKKYGFSATDYVISGCVGMVTTPNSCHANTSASYMTWNQITQLKNTFGWEIGSHTVTHPYLATSDPTDQPLPISNAQMVQEVSQSKADLAARGINATAFATPYGDYNNSVLAEIAKSYSSQRGFADTGYNSWPNSDYLIKEQQVQGGVSVATVKGYIDSAMQHKQWLVLVFHDIKVNASRKPNDYQYSTANLDQIAAYVKSQNVAVTKISDGLVTSNTNLLANSSFNDGIADGWSTDSPVNITKDTNNNGSYPDPTNSIKLVASTSNTHLFSPRVSVSSTNTYMLKNFLNVQQLTSGEVGYYIDEYDASGNWISGQYKTAETSSFVEELNFAYTPSSTAVTKASLQVIVRANSGITAYLDNAQWFPLTNNLPPANLMPNGTFDHGIADGWSTDDPADIVKDTGGKGSPSDPINSIKLTATSKNTHLFSSKVTVNPTRTYSLSSYLNVQQLTSGEVGYYIDEYDASGNWISGQYKTGKSNIAISTVAFQYTPSSLNVKSSSLQVIVVGNSGIVAYLDAVTWR